jgi:RND family efflux transporter MFP subunit
MADTAERTSRGWIGWAQVGLLVIALAAGIYFARSPSVAPIGEESIRSTEAPSVRVLHPVVGSHSLTVALTGEVHARAPVALRPLASGRVVEVSPALRAGGTFSAGETLLVVDPEDAELRLERAQGMLDAARGRLRRHQDQGALDAQQYRERHPGAEVPASVARLGRIERFEGRVRAAIADVKLAKLRLSETRFSLPFDGTVIAAPVSVGELVSRANGVGTVFRTGHLEVRAPIEVADLAYLGDPRGRQAAVLAGGQRFEAVVSQVSSVLAPRTRLSLLLLDFADANAPPPGTFVRVTLDGPAFDDAYLLPPEAHRADDSVWVVDDGKLLRETPSTLGRTDAGWIVAAFDARDGLVLGAVPGERAGLAVKAVDNGGRR